MITKGDNFDADAGGITAQAIEKYMQMVLHSDDSADLMQTLGQLQALLERIVPGTFDRRAAVSRINNARRFLESQESGAARFEMRLLIGSFAPQMEPG